MTLRVAVTGATGLIGTALQHHLRAAGHQVLPISRRALPGGVRWDPAANHLDPAPLQGIDAVIHLAGAGIADRRWTAARKRELTQSRVASTTLIARTVATLSPKPRVMLAMSAVGIYGNRGDTLLDESATLGDDFLGQLGQQWEAAAAPARDAGIRVVHPRLGVVLTAAGGALARMLPAFRAGVAGPLGGGRQWLSWIAIDDALAALSHVLTDTSLHGPINVVAPHPVTNAEFTRTLAVALHRPAVIPVPAVMLRALFGEMAAATLLASQRAVPRQLEQHGFVFRYGELGAALAHLLRRPSSH